MQIETTISLASTVLLTAITVYYAVVNHRILSFQRKMYDLERRPYINYDGILLKIFAKKESIEKGQGDLQFGIKLKNVSKVMAVYTIRKLVVSLENRAIHEPKYLTQGGFLYPDQTTDFHYDIFENVDLSVPVIHGKLEYEIEFHSEERKRYISTRAFDLTVFVQQQHVEWRTIRENETEEVGRNLAVTTK